MFTFLNHFSCVYLPSKSIIKPHPLKLKTTCTHSKFSSYSLILKNIALVFSIENLNPQLDGHNCTLLMAFCKPLATYSIFLPLFHCAVSSPNKEFSVAVANDS